jgi:phosphate transport system substrate-binding protein
MVNLAQAWAEAHHKKHPEVSIDVKGGGSGVGIAALCSGKIEIATASRQMKPKEIELAKNNTGKEPKEFKVGLDALAIYVNKNNPIESISIPELAQMYGEAGSIAKWKDLNIEISGCQDGRIMLIGRQNSSGTYAYFKEAVLGEKGEYRRGISAGSGSSDVVATVSTTPCAIGYSGMGYRTSAVKVAKVSKEKGSPGVEPSIESATDGSYPISRPLFIYTLGEPSGNIKAFAAWILSDEGQKIVEEVGYVPLPKP